MDSAVALFLIVFGCGDDMTECHRIDVAPIQFASLTNCDAQQPAALMSKAAMSADYPTIVAQCISGKKLAAIGLGPVDLTQPLRH